MSKAKDSSFEAKAKDVKIFEARPDFFSKPRPRTQNYFKANFKDKPESALRLLTK